MLGTGDKAGIIDYQRQCDPARFQRARERAPRKGIDKHR